MEERRLREVKKLTRKEGCLGLNKGPPVSRMSEQRWFPGRAEQHQEKLGAEPEGRGGHCQSITSRPRTTDGMTMVQVWRAEVPLPGRLDGVSQVLLQDQRKAAHRLFLCSHRSDLCRRKLEAHGCFYSVQTENLPKSVSLASVQP